MAWAYAAIAVEPATKRAKPPEFPPEDRAVFFEDARDQLVGDRPTDKTTPPAAVAHSADDQPNDDFRWSALISGDALATEVKRIASQLGEPLTNPVRFAAKGNMACQANFSQLAVLFAIIADYDGEVRWRDDAATFRDALARAAANCKTADDQTLAEAQERAGDVEDLVRGGRLARNPGRPLPADQWNTLAERAQLMQRIQTAFQDRIRPQLADARQFKKAAVEVRHEAEIIAALSEVIRRPKYEYWDDDTFIDYARQLQGAATDLSRAAAEQDYETARAAAARAGQACADCHDGYRL